ncbi:hypothetical protein C8R42DRAFT_713206 [Lentinula raphanica]|nr:hypothetical protein C8R42DRAFT_713206 [Lentinula raphanica]
MFSGAHNFNISDATFNASGRDINTLNYYSGSGKTVLINDKVDEDIATYVENQLQYVFEIINHATLKDEIKAILMEKADGGFRYIDCQLQTLGNCATAAMVKKKSTLLPSNLQQTYIRKNVLSSQPLKAAFKPPRAFQGFGAPKACKDTPQILGTLSHLKVLGYSLRCFEVL